VRLDDDEAGGGAAEWFMFISVGADPQPHILERHDAAGDKVVLNIVEMLEQMLRLRRGPATLEPAEQDDRGQTLPGACQQPTKVGIGRHQNALVRSRMSQHRDVVVVRHAEVTDVQPIVTSVPQERCQQW
jgi:hypothetical protein